MILYFSRITPPDFSRARPLEAIEAEQPIQQTATPEEPVQTKNKGFIARAFTYAAKAAVKTVFHPYLVLPIAIYAGGLRAYVVTEQYVEAKYGARNDWSLPGSCTVLNAANGKEYSFASKDSRDIKKGTQVVSNARAAFLGCRDVMNSAGFKFGRLDLTYDLYIDQMRGFQGEINGSMGGTSRSYDAAEPDQATEYMKDLPYYALKRQMQLIGKANTPEWYLYQTLTLQRDFQTWASDKWQTVTTNVDNLRGNVADFIRPSSPSSQGTDSGTSLAPQVQ